MGPSGREFSKWAAQRPRQVKSMSWVGANPARGFLELSNSPMAVGLGRRGRCR